MSQTTQMTIVGMKRFKGDVEGKGYDSTTLFVAMNMGGENASGATVVEHKYGSSDNFAKLSGIPFPFNAEVTYRQEATTKGMVKTIVELVKPIPAVNTPPRQ
jgi:hypothetical protein